MIYIYISLHITYRSIYLVYYLRYMFVHNLNHINVRTWLQFIKLYHIVSTCIC